MPEEKKTVKRKKGENERRAGERENKNIYMKKGNTVTSRVRHLVFLQILGHLK